MSRDEGNYQPARRPTWPAIGVVLLLALHVGLIAYMGVHWSPNIDELALIAGGMVIWQDARFDVYCVNPPLVRGVATIPILFMPHEEDWGEVKADAGDYRQEFGLGRQFVDSHPGCWECLLVAARWALLPFAVAGGLFCFFWATELFGRKSGLLALGLWCFSPNVLTWSAVICTDGVAAATGIGAGYFFWKWLKRPAWARVPWAGVFLGLAQLSKMTWGVLFPLWPALWWLATWHRHDLSVSRRESFLQLIAILVLGLYSLNLGYGFDGSFTRLGQYTFHSSLLAGGDLPGRGGESGNRFAGSLAGWIPIPLPEDYVRGVDLQKLDFEHGMPSYLFGTWSDRGWWYYYLVGLALKVPLGTWGLVLLAAIAACHSRRCMMGGDASRVPPRTGCHGGLFDQITLLAPALGVIVLASSQDGFSRHFRYVLLAFPFAFVWISRVARWIHRDHVYVSAAILGCLGWSICSSLTTFPFSISYFNALAGGAENGHRSMLHSSFSWTHEHFYLRRWLRAHPEVEAPYMQLGRSVSLESLGIRNRGEPPTLTSDDWDREGVDPHRLGPVPGWHVISVQQIHQRDGAYLYFRELTPVTKIGYSVNIYHIGYDEANRVRRKLGIPKLTKKRILPEQLVADMRTARNSGVPIRVAVFATDKNGASSDEKIQIILDRDRTLASTWLTVANICAGQLQDYQVLLVPGGCATEQGSSLGNAGREAIRDFVDGGGGYVGVCAGAYLATAKYPWSLGLVNAQTMTGTRYVPGQGPQKAAFRGSGNAALEFSDAGRSVLGVRSEQVKVWYSSGPIFSPTNESDLPDYVPLAYFRSEVCEYPFQVGTMIHSPAIISASFGRGCVILFSPHPETTPALNQLLVQAIRAVSAFRETPSSDTRPAPR